MVRLDDCYVLSGCDCGVCTGEILTTGGKTMKKFDEKKEATQEYKKARKAKNKKAKASRKRNRV